MCDHTLLTVKMRSNPQPACLTTATAGARATPRRYSVEDGRNTLRDTADISLRDLVDYYFVALKACIDLADVGAFMCSYNVRAQMLPRPRLGNIPQPLQPVLHKRPVSAAGSSSSQTHVASRVLLLAPSSSRRFPYAACFFYCFSFFCLVWCPVFLFGLPCWFPVLGASLCTPCVPHPKAINGTATCGDHWLNVDVVRNTWNFTGVIESDCGAISGIQAHGNAFNQEGAAVKVSARAPRAPPRHEHVRTQFTHAH